MSLFAVVAYAALCYLVGLLGKDRKFGLWGLAAISFVFTPVIGILILLASDKKAPAAPASS